MELRFRLTHITWDALSAGARKTWRHDSFLLRWVKSFLLHSNSSCFGDLGATRVFTENNHLKSDSDPARNIFESEHVEAKDGLRWTRVQPSNARFTCITRAKSPLVSGFPFVKPRKFRVYGFPEFQFVPFEIHDMNEFPILEGFNRVGHYYALTLEFLHEPFDV